MNSVFIATSLDGYIADRDGGLEWLQSVPNPDNLDLGWADFMGRIDAVVMGRNTFETVCGFDCPWPYSRPVFVLSNSLKSLPEKYEGKAERIGGSPEKVQETLQRKGYSRLYVDGGMAVRGFLEKDMIDEMIITVIPVLLGGGTPLFGDLPGMLAFDHVKTEVLLGAMVQSRYCRKR